MTNINLFVNDENLMFPCNKKSITTQAFISEKAAATSNDA